MIAQGDESALARLVGTATFERGRAYAEHGAVRNCTWNPGGTHVVGQVQGGAARPYVASVRLTRAPNRQLSAIEATCSCPVGYNCKHAVALVLADEPPGDVPHPPTLTLVRGDRASTPRPPAAGTGRSRRRGARTAADAGVDLTDWALPLEALLDAEGDDPDDPADDTGSAQLALQFELIVTPDATGRSVRRSSVAAPGIRIRPVIPGQSGHWVRSGVSW